MFFRLSHFITVQLWTCECVRLSAHLYMVSMICLWMTTYRVYSLKVTARLAGGRSIRIETHNLSISLSWFLRTDIMNVLSCWNLHECLVLACLFSGADCYKRRLVEIGWKELVTSWLVITKEALTKHGSSLPTLKWEARFQGSLIGTH